MAGRDIKKIIEAGAHQNVAAAGDYIHLKSTSGPVRIDIGGRSVDMSAGDKMKSHDFRGFVVHNDTVADITCIFVVGEGDFTQGASTGEVTVTKASNFDGVDDVVLAAAADNLLLAADDTRRTAYITNLSGNGVSIRVGGTGSNSATKGTPVAPGETLTLNTTGDISCYSSAVQNVAVSYEAD